MTPQNEIRMAFLIFIDPTFIPSDIGRKIDLRVFLDINDDLRNILLLDFMLGPQEKANVICSSWSPDFAPVLVKLVFKDMVHKTINSLWDRRRFGAHFFKIWI
jgi:hypothetical protein